MEIRHLKHGAARWQALAILQTEEHISPALQIREAETFQLDSSYQNYSLEEKNGVCTAKNTLSADQREFGSFEVLSFLDSLIMRL